MCLSSFACCVWLLTENGKARHQKRDISLLTLEEGNGFWLQNDLWAGVCGGEVRTRDQVYTDSAFRLSVRNKCFGFVWISVLDVQCLLLTILPRASRSADTLWIWAVLFWLSTLIQCPSLGSWLFCVVISSAVSPGLGMSYCILRYVEVMWAQLYAWPVLCYVWLGKLIPKYPERPLLFFSICHLSHLYLTKKQVPFL